MYIEPLIDEYEVHWAFNWWICCILSLWLVNMIYVEFLMGEDDIYWASIDEYDVYWVLMSEYSIYWTLIDEYDVYWAFNWWIWCILNL